MRKFLILILVTFIVSCMPNPLRNVSVDGLSYDGTNIYYDSIICAKMGAMELAYDNKKIVREVTFIIVDEDYNHLAYSIIKYVLMKHPDWEVEVEIKR